MNIVVKGAEYTKREIYALTKSPRIQKMSDHVGETLQVDKYLIYVDDDNKPDTEMEILSIQVGDTVIATNSATAIKEFRAIVGLMEGEPFAVEVMTGTSKNGRTYITLALV